MSMPICFKCKKRADEISSVVCYSKEQEMSPEEFIMEEEGTYEILTNTFICDDCFIQNGCPTGNRFAKTIDVTERM